MVSFLLVLTRLVLRIPPFSDCCPFLFSFTSFQQSWTLPLEDQQPSIVVEALEASSAVQSPLSRQRQVKALLSAGTPSPLPPTPSPSQSLLPSLLPRHQIDLLLFTNTPPPSRVLSPSLKSLNPSPTRQPLNRAASRRETASSLPLNDTPPPQEPSEPSLELSPPLQVVSSERVLRRQEEEQESSLEPQRGGKHSSEQETSTPPKKLSSCSSRISPRRPSS